MLLTGDMIEAAEARLLGLVNRAGPGEALEAETLDLARKVMSKSPLILKIGKEAFYRQIEHGLVEAYAYASQVMTTNMLARDAEEGRSEEHTSELQSLMRTSYTVFCLKKILIDTHHRSQQSYLPTHIHTTHNTQ